MNKKLTYAGYASVELTEDTDAFVSKREGAKNRWEVMSGDMVTVLNKGFSIHFQPIDEGVRVVSANFDDLYGDGTQVFLSSEAMDVLTAFSVQFWKLAHGCDWKPEPPARFGNTGRKYR